MKTTERLNEARRLARRIAEDIESLEVDFYQGRISTKELSSALDQLGRIDAQGLSGLLRDTSYAVKEAMR